MFFSCLSDLTNTQLCSIGLKFLKCAIADLETVLTVSPVESEIICICIFLLIFAILLSLYYSYLKLYKFYKLLTKKPLIILIALITI